MKKNMIGIFGVLLVLLLNCSKSQRNYVIVVDTSGSMSYPKNTLAKVKESLPEILKLPSIGDTVTLIRFDSESEVILKQKIDTDDDRAKVKSAVDSLNAKGPYTNLGKMIISLKNLSADLDEQSYIIVLTDGQNDPAPGSGEKSVQLKDYTVKTPGPIQKPYIYYISLGNEKSTNIEESLKTVSPEVKTIVTKADDVKAGSSVVADKPGKAGLSEKLGIGEVAADIRKKDYLFSARENLYPILALLGVLFLLFLFLLVKFLQKRKKLTGNLEYYLPGGGQVHNNYSLKKVTGGKLKIGSRMGTNLRIKDLGLPREISLYPGKRKGADYLYPDKKSSLMISFFDQKVQGKISMGDKFKIGNYIFEYKNGKED